VTFHGTRAVNDDFSTPFTVFVDATTQGPFHARASRHERKQSRKRDHRQKGPSPIHESREVIGKGFDHLRVSKMTIALSTDFDRASSLGESATMKYTATKIGKPMSRMNPPTSFKASLMGHLEYLGECDCGPYG
jgi:hypothetical protein